MIKVDVSVGANYMFTREIPGMSLMPGQTLEHVACVSIGSVTYDPEKKTVKEVAVEAAYSDFLIDCQFRITTEKDTESTTSWVVVPLSLPDRMPIGGAVTGKRFEDWDELQRCLRDLATPTSDALKNEGTRIFGGDPVPAQVLLKWKLITPESLQRFSDAQSARLVNVTGMGGIGAVGGIGASGIADIGASGFGGVSVGFGAPSVGFSGVSSGFVGASSGFTGASAGFGGRLIHTDKSKQQGEQGEHDEDNKKD